MNSKSNKKTEDTTQEAHGTRISSAGQNPQEVSSTTSSIIQMNDVFNP